MPFHTALISAAAAAAVTGKIDVRCAATVESVA
jgi:hypothetical protein